MGDPLAHLFQDQRWYLNRGDSLAWLRSLPDACVDAVITDPPYSSGGRTIGEKSRSTVEKYIRGGVAKEYDDFDGDHRDQRSWIMWASLWLSEAWRASKLGAVCCLFTDWRMLPATTDALQGGGWMWRGVVPWDKGGGARPTMGRFRAQSEFLVWGSKGEMDPARLDGAARRCLPGVFLHVVKPDEKFHTTGKPLPLMLDVIDICAPGSVVLDPFGGSGTTSVAALRKGHRVLISEMGPSYQDMIAARLSAEVAGLDWRAPDQLGLFGA